jgi:hypothetical protein
VDFGEGTVDLPVAGKIKKRYVMIPAGLALAYVTYRWYQTRAEDLSADEAASDGTYTTDDLSEYGQSTSGGSTVVTGNNGAQNTDGTGGMSTNAAWTNKAVELLTQQGYDGATVAGALGDFLARRGLTPTEATIARAAVAMTGQPPVGGPFPFIEQATTGTGVLAAPSNLRKWDTATDTIIGIQWDAVPGAHSYRIFRSDLGPEPIGHSYDTTYHAKGLTPDKSYSFYVAALSGDAKTGKHSNTFTAKTAARKLAKPTGLKASSVKSTSFRVSCTPVKGAEIYKWYLNGRESGATDAPYRDFVGLKRNTTHRVSVRADLHTQAPGPASSVLSVKTKK